MKKHSSNVNPKKEKTGFKINQIFLLNSLIIIVLINFTNYWLDDRPDVYHFGWLFVNVVWYVGIITGIVLVIGKIRFGFILSGILSWITLAFWSFDNFYVIFGISILSPHHNEIITLRNFIGILITIVAIITSHNAFHKVIAYKYKEKSV